MKTTKHFITGVELSLGQLQKIIQNAIRYKNGHSIPKHTGKILTAIFANPSLRTRLSFESGMTKLRGSANILNASDSWEFEYEEGVTMNGNKQEHIKEAAQVLSAYSDVIALRKSELMTKQTSVEQTQTWSKLKQDNAINKLAKYSTKPIINMESNMFHPCQSLADMMTMVELFGTVKKKKYVLTWAPHLKPLPLATPHSQILTPSIFGMDVTLVHPEGFDLDGDVIEMCAKHAEQSGGSFNISNNQEEAFKNADVIMAKSWASLQYFGNWNEESQHRNNFKNWMITQEKMNNTSQACFMHCLPVRRNVIVSDEVLDTSTSVVIQQAENRMWAQMGLIDYLLS